MISGLKILVPREFFHGCHRCRLFERVGRVPTAVSKDRRWLLVAYKDVNGSGTFELEDLFADSVALAICYDSNDGMAPQPISIVYSREPTDFLTAMYSGMYGIGVGWSILITVEDAPVLITGAELNNMVIDSTCVFR
jgi:hypothetical protein